MPSSSMTSETLAAPEGGVSPLTITVIQRAAAIGLLLPTDLLWSPQTFVATESSVLSKKFLFFCQKNS